MKSSEKFKRIIKTRKITIVKISKDLNIANSTLYEWSSGKYIPKYDKLIRIANYLDVDINLLYDDNLTIEEFDNLINKKSSIKEDNAVVEQAKPSICDRLEKLKPEQQFMIEYIIGLMIASNKK